MSDSFKFLMQQQIMPATIRKSKSREAVALDKVVIALQSELGWMALSSSGGMLERLTIGHPSERAALEDLASWQHGAAAGMVRDEPDRATALLIARLKAYAAGADDDFRDVKIDESGRTAFQRRVISATRRIPRGRTLSYSQLAARSGAPGAARAAGTVMAKNCFPLVVPCHRVVGSAGLGGYSARHGLSLKRWLLELEGVTF